MAVELATRFGQLRGDRIGQPLFFAHRSDQPGVEGCAEDIVFQPQRGVVLIVAADVQPVAQRDLEILASRRNDQSDSFGH
jgi:hypothetical protein